ncbi:MAG TPA: acyl-CoA dehydrogenase, partial [Flavipsychrobacter sp.]|nr:acyl-CoA dehydrogenase [Flavipsychrobacter sp.]
FAAEQKLLANFKKAILMCAGAAAQKLMMTLQSEQEILMHIADMILDTFQAECMLLRTIKMHNAGNANAALALDATKTFMCDAADRVNHSGKNAINAFATGDEQRMMLMGLKRFTKAENFNTKDARRRLAAKLVEVQHYWF